MSVIVQRGSGNKPGPDIEVFLRQDQSQIERGRQEINKSHTVAPIEIELTEPIGISVGDIVDVYDANLKGEVTETRFNRSGENGSISCSFTMEVPA